MSTAGHRGYLSGKMVHGATALHYFFEGLVGNRGCRPEEYAAELGERYSITPNQKAYLSTVATRASRAQGIVRYLEDRFGLDETGDFKDPEGLHRALFDGQRIQKKLGAHSYNIAIGFTMPGWVNEPGLGYAQRYGSGSDQLDVPLEETVSALVNGRKTNCAQLVFHRASDACIKSHADTALDNLKVILGDRGNPGDPCDTDNTDNSVLYDGLLNFFEKTTISSHELRHVIDNIIGSESIYVETPALLYEGCLLDFGLHLDKKREIARINLGVETNTRALNSGSEFLAGIARERLAELEQKRLEISDSFAGVESTGLAELSPGALRVLSYLFSTIDYRKLPRRLELMIGAYRSGLEKRKD